MKLYNNDKTQVAILISSTYGTAFASANELDTICDSILCESRTNKAFQARYLELTGKTCYHNLDDLSPIWIETNKPFVFGEYDGKEWIEYVSDMITFTL